VADPLNPTGEMPNDEQDDDALGGGREQDDQHAGDGDDDSDKRQRNAEAKRLRLERNEYRDKLKAIEDRDKSEMQKAIERAESAEKRADSVERRLLAVEVAAKHGIPPEEAHRLQGDTREALVEDAKAFAKRFGLDSSNGEQRPDFSSGVRRPVQRPKTMNDVIRQAAGR
jgi:hypothetical protein